jgi:hypothetical protein
MHHVTKLRVNLTLIKKIFGISETSTYRKDNVL